ncbi:MAG TPA: ABC transporter permease [Bryobacteraceae bacterium]|nr:ABC transporter permease [Bryobacteraceae bacterium]
MGWTDFVLRLRALVRHGRAESELDEELRFHMEMEARKAQAGGLSQDEARRNARVQFGGVDQVREDCRDARGLTFLENLARDLRFGARVLRKTPGFTAIAVLSLAIGIGANTAVFTLLDTVLLRMLPVRNPEQLVVARWGTHADLDISATWATGGQADGIQTRNVFSWPIFLQMRAHSHELFDVMGFSPLGPVNVAVNGQALQAGAMVVSGNYFQALGVGTILGRAISDDADTTDGLPSAVISYRFWERTFGLDPGAVGKTLYLNGQPCVVIGVTPKSFFGVSAGGFMRTPNLDLVLPVRWRDRLEGFGGLPVSWFGGEMFWIQTMGRLHAGREAAARAELAALFAANLEPDDKRELGSEVPRVFLDSGSQGLEALRRTYHKPLWILMAVVGLTLLMACANLGGLLLARAGARQKEIMLRLAVGASRGRLVRQLLVEGALLSLAGMAAGLAMAWWGVRALQALVASGASPIPIEVAPDTRVLGFTAAVSAIATFLFALAPALRATRVDVGSGLKEDAPVSPGPRRMGTGRVLLALQVAVALVLLAGATLFTRSLLKLRSLPLGFDPHQVTLFNVAPGKNGYDAVRGNQLYARLWERLRQIRGVTSVSLSTSRLLGGYVSNGGILVDSRSKTPAPSDFNFVGADFLKTMGIPVVLGRGIEERDIASASQVAVINEMLARSAFGEGSPVGRRFRWEFGKAADIEVIGVAKDAKYARLRGDNPPTLYVPYTQRPFGWPPEVTFEVRSAAGKAETTAGIRRAVSEIDRMLPITNLETQEAQIDDSLAQEHLFATLVSLFSGITLALACVGLYGSVAYAVTRRTRELGVRMALGANRTAVFRMLLAQVAITVAAGLAVGLPATWMLTRIVESQLYGISAHDPASIAMACAGVALVAMFAALLPARRAMRIDPVRALRYE